MKHIYFIIATAAVLFLGLTYCTEPYNLPDEFNGSNSHLVVDGFINGNDSSFITLSRSRNIGDEHLVEYENSATVFLEDETGFNYYLVSINNGTYALPPIALNYNTNYKLRIYIGDKEYLSDNFQAIRSPEIDSVSWKNDAKGVKLFVSTHDDTENSRYYKWDFEETWEYTSVARSRFLIKNGTIVKRDLDNDDIFRCWKTEVSHNVNLGSSAGLTKNIIYDAPIHSIEASSFKLSEKYSILVKQHVLTEKAFNYWLNLQKNTEQPGSIFDPQPTQISSNIHCVSDPKETVIGFISASSTTEKRIFIGRKELQKVVIPKEYSSCSIDTFRTIAPDNVPYYPKDPEWVTHNFGTGKYVPITIRINITPTCITCTDTVLIYSTKECVDCRERGGVTKKPSFWP